MDKNYLITYRNKENSFQFDWFETEEELKEFASNSDIEVIDALEILGAKDIDI